MTRRSRRWVPALVVAVGIVIFLMGCGGAAAPTTTSSTVARVTPTTAIRNIGSAVEDLLYTKLAVTQETPEEYVAAVGQARPVAMLFYVAGNVDDEKVRDVFTGVQADFPGYTFLAYDYKTPNAYGDLSMLLQVNYPPEIVLVDRAGKVRNIWNGYVDEGSLRQCLINLGQG